MSNKSNQKIIFLKIYFPLPKSINISVYIIYTMKRKPVQLPPHIHEELKLVKEKIDNQYGFELSYWEVISYLIRFYLQNCKRHEHE